METFYNAVIFYWQMYKDIGTKLMNIREPGSNGKLSEETKKLIGEKAKIPVHIFDFLLLKLKKFRFLLIFWRIGINRNN